MVGVGSRSQTLHDRAGLKSGSSLSQLPRGCTNYINLGSFLIKPVQRVMRYPLLLMELLSATPESHPDKAPLTAAVLAVKEINVNINEYKRRKDLGEELGSECVDTEVCQLHKHEGNLSPVDSDLSSSVVGLHLKSYT